MNEISVESFLEKYRKAGYSTEWTNAFIHWFSLQDIFDIIADSQWRHIDVQYDNWTMDGWEIVYNGEIDPGFDIENFF